MTHYVQGFFLQFSISFLSIFVCHYSILKMFSFFCMFWFYFADVSFLFYLEGSICFVVFSSFSTYRFHFLQTYWFFFYWPPFFASRSCVILCFNVLLVESGVTCKLYQNLHVGRGRHSECLKMNRCQWSPECSK